MPRFPGYDETLHQAVSAWFLGPRAENFAYLDSVMKIVLQEQHAARVGYYPDDPDFITQAMQDTEPFKKQMTRLETAVKAVAQIFSHHHVPFWSPRYNGHMTGDTTLPGIAGYLTGMLFNPNNVAVEASPFTTEVEKRVGLELCQMVKYNIDPEVKPTAWGHVTCDGSVANLESMWAARNLKFYPLSVVLAMERGQLGFIADSFMVPKCTGEMQLLSKFETWDLLNIAPYDVLDIPDRLYAQYSMSPTFLQSALNDYLIQSIGKDNDMFRERFGDVVNKMVYFTCLTKHYSWPKGAAITGIGSSNCIGIKVDNNARMLISDLKEKLDQCQKEKRPVFAVVAIIGSTEHGACDPLMDVVELRDQYRDAGMSFVVHADGAWGTYFATTLKDEVKRGPGDVYFVPSIALKEETQANLRNLRYADSITVDPHKSGYIQYPAGGLLYRDERMRYLITWTSPYIERAGEENIGTYGLEGSKPGAAPLAVWISHMIIGLNPSGYGAILGEAVFGAAMMYAYFATMSTKDTSFIVAPMNMLPAEAEGGDVEAQKTFIRQRILPVTNEQLVQDSAAMKLIQEMGSDLSINAFSTNFKLNGEPNKDVIAANDLNRRIYERLSLVSIKQTMNDKPVLLTSTKFSQATYLDCLTTFKRRLGLDPNDPNDLYCLSNVVMSPFPTEMNFTRDLIQAFQQVLEEEAVTSVEWNTVSPDIHGFVMQGTDKLFLVHLPMFNMANHRYQLVITGDLNEEDMSKYVSERNANPGQLFTLSNVDKEVLTKLLEQGSFNANVDKGPIGSSERLLSNVPLSNIKVLISRQLNTARLDMTYPANTVPFFLYGTGNQLHIEHALLATPNIQLNSDQVQLSIPVDFSEQPFVVAQLKGLSENAMQPFPTNDTISKDSKFFFKPGAAFQVQLTKDLEGTQPIGEGKLTLGKLAFYDNDEINMFPAAKGTDETKNRGPMHRGPVDIDAWAEMVDSVVKQVENV